MKILIETMNLVVFAMLPFLWMYGVFMLFIHHEMSFLPLVILAPVCWYFIGNDIKK